MPKKEIKIESIIQENCVMGTWETIKKIKYLRNETEEKNTVYKLKSRD